MEKNILVTDSRFLTQELLRPVISGAQKILYKQWDPVSANKNSISFSCQTPFPDTDIDRNIQIVCPLRITCSAVWDVSQDGQFLAQPNKVGIRSYPLHKACNRVSLNLNNHTFSINIGDIMSAIEHTATSRKLKLLEYSKCSTYGTCQSQKFSDMNLGIRSGLSTFEDSISGIAPQNFPFTVFSNFPAIAANDYTATCVIDLVTTENLYLSPCFYGDWEHDYNAFRGIQTMDVNFQLYNENPQFRMIAIDNTNALGVDRGGTISGDLQVNFDPSDNFTYDDLHPKLLVQYLQRKTKLDTDKPIVYPHFEIENFKQAHKQTVAPSTTDVVQFRDVLLPRLPTKIYIWVRKPNSVYLGDPFTPDVFCAIQNLEISWNNRTVLSECHKATLYDLAVKNGLQYEYAQWSGLLLNRNVTSQFGEPATQFGGTGSIICLDVLDLGIDSDISHDPNSDIPFGFKATIKNISVDTFVPEMHVAFIYDGLMQLHNGVVSTKLGQQDAILSQADVQAIKLAAPKRVGSTGQYQFDVNTLIRKNLVRD